MADTKTKVAILANDLTYIKSSQKTLERALNVGFKEIREDLKGIKEHQQVNSDDILVAKSSIRTLKVVGGVALTIISLVATVYAALWQ